MKRNLPLLQLLIKTPPRQRKAILCAATADLVAAISEIALNALKGNIPLSPRQVSMLRKKKLLIRKLSSKQVSLKKKKELVKQSGGFLAPLLSIAIPLITELIRKRNS